VVTVRLSTHGQQLLEAALARGLGNSPEEVIERALEAASSATTNVSDPERAGRREAVAGVLAFREKHHLTLGPGLRIQDLVHEGHKY
jgi:N-acyl-L-homoserine lactone synthetase